MDKVIHSDLGELGGVPAVGPGGYVSATTIGAGLGLVLPGVGFVIGAVIGGVVDVFLSARNKKKQRDAMKKAFYIALLKRYDTQIFISTLERMGPAMVYLQSLGLKPGTDAFDQALTKKLYTEVGYKGNCGVDIFGPAAPGQKRPAIASIDKSGRMQAYSPHIDQAYGPKWAEACRAFHHAALQAWADEQKDNILYFRDIEKEKKEAKRAAITRLLINGGIILALAGYSIRQKKKLRYMREHRSERKAVRKRRKKKKPETETT
jgi:hypothetical protein